MSFLWIVLGGALSLLLSKWLAFRIRNRRAIRLCRAIPSAQPSYPVVGNVATFASRSIDKVAEDLFKTLDESVLRGHRAVCFWICDYPVVFITDPDDMRKVFNSSLSRGRAFEASAREFARCGLLTAPPDHWKVTRKHLNSSFRPGNLEPMMPTFNRAGRQLVAALSGHVEGPVFDLMPPVLDAAIAAIGVFLYGAEAWARVTQAQIDVYARGIVTAGEVMALRVLRPWLRNDSIFNLFYGKESNYLKAIRLSVENVVNEVAESPNADEDGVNAGSRFEKGFHPILDSMRELKKKVQSIKDEHVMDEIVTFFGTGTDSIAMAVSACLLATARFPDVQQKAFEEICSVWPEGDREDVEYSDLTRLTYLEQVIKEALRFFPVLPCTLRAPNRDVDLGGYTIPARKSTLLYISSVNFNPKYFPDPRRFDPGRFSPEKKSEDVFTPFGRGVRNCVGKDYAMILIKVMVVHVLRKYTLSTDVDITNLKKKYMLTAPLLNGYNVSLTKRISVLNQDK